MIICLHTQHSFLNLEILELLCCSSHGALALLSRGRILGQFAGEGEESGSSGDVFPERLRNVETLLKCMLAQRSCQSLPEV